MALDYQPIDVPLSGGLQQDMDPHLVGPGSWLKVRNLRRNKHAGFSKRFGTVALSRDIFGGGTLSSCQALGFIDDVLLAVDDSHQLYERAPNASSWVNRSTRPDTSSTFPLFPVTIDHKGLYGLSNKIVTFDWCASADGLVHAVAEVKDTTGASIVVEMVFDGSNGALVRGPTQVEAGHGPRIFPVGTSTVVVVYASSAAPGQLLAREKTSTGTYGASTDLVAGGLAVAYTKYAWDARAYGGADSSTSAFIIAYERADHVIAYKTFTVGPIAAQFSGTSASLGFQDYDAFSISSAKSESGFWVCWSRLAAGIPLVKFTFVGVSGGLPESFAPVTCINAGGSATFGAPGRLGICRANTTKAYICCGGCEVLPSRAAMQSVVVDNTGGLVGPAAFNNQVWPVGRPFVGPDSRVYVWVRDISYLGIPPTTSATNPVPGSMMLVDTQALDTIGAPRPVGRVVGRGPVRSLEVSTEDFVNGRVLVTPVTIGNQVFCAAPMLRQKDTKQHPVERVWATWSDPKRLRFVQLGASTYIQPGEMFDRNRPTEIGFHLFPPAIPTVSSAGGGGVLAAGPRAYTVVIRHTNSAGETVRSCPSGAQFVTTVANDKVLLSGRLNSYTDRQSTDTTIGNAALEYCVLELYRTEANGATFYLVTEFAMPTSGATGVDYSFVDDTLSDASLIEKPILYTAQQAPNLCPPSLRSMVNWRGKLCGIGPDRRTIWISNTPKAGEQAYFNEAYNAYSSMAELTALGVVDDKLIAFSESSAWLVDGTPADEKGEGNTLFLNDITADVGCTDERGVVMAGPGILFRDRRSFSLLTRNLDMEVVGLPAQDEVKDRPVVKSSTYVDLDREARFCISAAEGSTTNIVLRYNFTVGKWLTSDYLNPTPSPDVAGAAVVASTVVDGVWYGAFSDGTVIREDTTLFTDSGTYVEDEIQSPWIRVGAIAGQQRTRFVVVKCERKTAADVTVEVDCTGRNMIEGDVLSETWQSSDIHNLPEYPNVELRKYLDSKQKASAVRVKIKSVAPSDEEIGTGEGVRYYGLTLWCGMRPGIGKGLQDGNKR